MLEYINWYLVELRLRLSGSLDPDRLDTILREVESHLKESTQRLMEAANLSELQAAKAAIDSFGKPEHVAAGYLSQQPGTVLRMPALWAVLAGATISTWAWVYNWVSLGGFFDNFGETWLNGLATVIGVFGLGLFVMGCRRGHRSFRAPILKLGVGAAVGLFFLLSFWIVGTTQYGQQGFSRFHLGRDVQTAERTIAKLDTLRQDILEGRVEFAKAKSLADLPPKFQSGAYAIPFTGFPLNEPYRSPYDRAGRVFAPSTCFAMVDGRIWGMSELATFAEAKSQWAHSEEYLKSIDRAQNELRGLLASAEEARSGRLLFVNSAVYGEPVGWMLVFLPVLLLIDAAVGALSRRRSAWPGRALA